MLSSKPKEMPARLIQFQMVLDQETGEAVTINMNVPSNASAHVLAGEIATLREACWKEIAATNARKLERQKVIEAAQERKIKEARERGAHLNAKRIDQERMERDKETIVMESIVEADKVTLSMDNGASAP